MHYTQVGLKIATSQVEESVAKNGTTKTVVGQELIRREQKQPDAAVSRYNETSKHAKQQ
jgi:hypothetical protein